MAFWNKLFDNKKKKSSDDDGQEQYFKDEYKTIEKKEPEKAKPQAKKDAKPEAKPAKSTVKKVPAAEAKTSVKKAEEKASSTAAKTTSATRSTEAKKSSATSKTTAAKSSGTKSTEVKSSTPKAAKPAAAKTEKAPSAKAASKPAKETELRDDSPEVKSAVAVKEGRETANGKFDIQRAKDGRFFFSLYASNHTVIAYSQIYSSITAVNTGIASVIANAEKAEIEDTTLKKPVSLPCPKWEIYIDKAGEYRFRLYAINGLCVCHSSHGYSTKSGCKGGIDSIRRFAKEASVDKSYLK